MRAKFVIKTFKTTQVKAICVEKQTDTVKEITLDIIGAISESKVKKMAVEEAEKQGCVFSYLKSVTTGQRTYTMPIDDFIKYATSDETAQDGETDGQTVNESEGN